MKKWFLILAAVIACAGCSTMEEAYFLDREYGQAQMASWEKMIVNPHPQHAESLPEGMEGIHAEPAMRVYHKSFSKEPTKTDVIKFGIVNE